MNFYDMLFTSVGQAVSRPALYMPALPRREFSAAVYFKVILSRGVSQPLLPFLFTFLFAFWRFTVILCGIAEHTHRYASVSPIKRRVTVTVEP